MIQSVCSTTKKGFVDLNLLGRLTISARPTQLVMREALFRQQLDAARAYDPVETLPSFAK